MSNRLPLILLLAAVACDPAGQKAYLPVVEVEPDAPLSAELDGSPAAPSALQEALVSITEPTVILLRPGRYDLKPAEFTDSTCGNCQELETPVPATRGLHLTVPGVRVVGPGADSAIIHTNAATGSSSTGATAVLWRG